MSPFSVPSSSRETSTSSSRKQRPNAPTVYPLGHYVGVRINKYETKAQAKARGQGNTGMIHPAVVLAGPDVNNRYDIATISTEHPDSPPRAPLTVFHPTTTITGEVSFYQRNVAHGDLRPWLDEKTGNITQPMSESQLMRLRSQMIIGPAPNGSYPPLSAMGNRPWGEESMHSQPVFGQGYIPQSTYPYPVNYQNAHLSPFPPSHEQFYNYSTSQGMVYGYPAPYNMYPDQGRPSVSGAIGGPPTYPGQDSTYYRYPSTSIGKSSRERR